MLCAAPTVLIGIANDPGKLSREARRGVRVLTAGAPPAATTIERIEGELGWVITQAYGLTETSPFITICESRPEHEKLLCAERSIIKACQGVELLTSGECQSSPTKFTTCSAGAIGSAPTAPPPNSLNADWLPRANANKPAGARRPAHLSS